MEFTKRIRLAAAAITVLGSFAGSPTTAMAEPAIQCSRVVEPCNGDDWEWAIDYANEQCQNSCSFSMTSCNVYWYCEREVVPGFECGPIC
jgi:hypothetical protein